MGVILSTRGWTAASITWTHADGAETYTLDGDVANAYDVATALVAWLDDPARVWAANVSGVSFTVGDDGARHRFVIAYTGTFSSIVTSASWDVFFGDTSATPDGVAEGTLAETPGIVGWVRVDNSPGVRSRSGSWRYGLAQIAPQRPAVELWLDEAAAHVLSQALRYAAVPRTAYLYDEDAATWRWVTIGEVAFEPIEGDPNLIRVSVECLGGAT